MPSITFENLTLGDDRSLEEDVGLLLRGQRRPKRGQDQFVHQWLSRAWRAANPEDRQLLSRAIGVHVGDDDVRARSEAIRFFQTERAADDMGGLLAALAADPARFDGVTDPLPGAPSDLRAELMRAVANSPSRSGAPGALDALRAEALRPGGGGCVVAGLFYGDQAWVMEHAEEIVKASPSAYTTLLLNLALKADTVAPFVARMRSVVPDDTAEAIVRERFAHRAELLQTALEALGRAEGLH
jgi:hypothetical protein